MTLSSDVDVIFASSSCAGRGVAVNARKGWWEIYGSIRRRFNEADVFPGAATNDAMKRELDFHDIDLSLKLDQALAKTEFRVTEEHLQFDRS